jgi:hypothetical protein
MKEHAMFFFSVYQVKVLNDLPDSLSQKLERTYAAYSSCKLKLKLGRCRQNNVKHNEDSIGDGASPMNIRDRADGYACLYSSVSFSPFSLFPAPPLHITLSKLCHHFPVVCRPSSPSHGVARPRPPIDWPCHHPVSPIARRHPTGTAAAVAGLLDRRQPLATDPCPHPPPPTPASNAGDAGIQSPYEKIVSKNLIK